MKKTTSAFTLLLAAALLASCGPKPSDNRHKLNYSTFDFENSYFNFDSDFDINKKYAPDEEVTIKFHTKDYFVFNLENILVFVDDQLVPVEGTPKHGELREYGDIYDEYSVTFKMPDHDVNIVTGYDDQSYVSDDYGFNVANIELEGGVKAYHRSIKDTKFESFYTYVVRPAGTYVTAQYREGDSGEWSPLSFNSSFYFDEEIGSYQTWHNNSSLLSAYPSMGDNITIKITAVEAVAHKVTYVNGDKVQAFAGEMSEAVIPGEKLSFLYKEKNDSDYVSAYATVEGMEPSYSDTLNDNKVDLTMPDNDITITFTVSKGVLVKFVENDKIASAAFRRDPFSLNNMGYKSAIPGSKIYIIPSDITFNGNYVLEGASLTGDKEDMVPVKQAYYGDYIDLDVPSEGEMNITLYVTEAIGVKLNAKDDMKEGDFYFTNSYSDDKYSAIALAGSTVNIYYYCNTLYSLAGIEVKDEEGADVKVTYEVTPGYSPSSGYITLTVPSVNIIVTPKWEKGESVSITFVAQGEIANKLFVGEDEYSHVETKVIQNYSTVQYFSDTKKQEFVPNNDITIIVCLSDKVYLPIITLKDANKEVTLDNFTYYSDYTNQHFGLSYIEYTYNVNTDAFKLEKDTTITISGVEKSDLGATVANQSGLELSYTVNGTEVQTIEGLSLFDEVVISADESKIGEDKKLQFTFYDSEDKKLDFKGTFDNSSVRFNIPDNVKIVVELVDVITFTVDYDPVELPNYSSYMVGLNVVNEYGYSITYYSGQELTLDTEYTIIVNNYMSDCVGLSVEVYVGGIFEEFFTVDSYTSSNDHKVTATGSVKIVLSVAE